MAKQNKERSAPMRAHPKFSDFVKTIKYQKQAEQKREIATSRITLAIYNQFTKYPELKKELEKADLK